MTQREAFEAWYRSRHPRYPAEWEAWQAATEHAARIALTAPAKADKQDQREACAGAILAGMAACHARATHKTPS